MVRNRSMNRRELIKLLSVEAQVNVMLCVSLITSYRLYACYHFRVLSMQLFNVIHYVKSTTLLHWKMLLVQTKIKGISYSHMSLTSSNIVISRPQQMQARPIKGQGWSLNFFPDRRYRPTTKSTSPEKLPRTCSILK